MCLLLFVVVDIFVDFVDVYFICIWIVLLMDYLVDVRLVVIGYINIYDLFMCKKKYGFRVGFFFLFLY